MAAPASVRVHGLRDLTRALERAGVAVSDLKSVMGEVGEMVAGTARPLTNPKSGRLAGSIRPAKQKTRAVIRAGGTGRPYAGVQHFGWPARNIRPKLYLYEALDQRRGDVLGRFDTALARITNGDKP